MSLSVTCEVWRKRIDEPGVFTVSPTVLRVEGERAGDGWSLRMTEQGTVIEWPTSLLKPEELAGVVARLELQEKWSGT